MFKKLDFLRGQVIDSNIKRDKLSDRLLKEAGLLLKKEREKQQLTRSILSIKTKISVAVIEAIENGWSSQLPEQTYLYPMLRILEIELGLEKFSLGEITQAESKKKVKDNENLAGDKIMPFLSRWPSSMLYSTCIFLTIFLLNRHHIFLSKQNVQTISPMINVVK
ncbi:MULTISPECIES: helix-turn-helix domain-containing protein [Prochlorococcus]|uniref:Helix-turn-helix protein n=1 Tax=Prochlorococcus marinus (strain SARG / CCMP1375 / SS120) TaxID=167539 RepID=Q7VBH7_PROMA|nr:MULTISPECIES: helix-turn-helix transcriptional regulator [Prochlorococcus]AAQ00160.1 Uncharacterized protein Pro_1115 [Prochlorococcus marinus subsp. marinus str. CCMP1375]KGG13957.1 putative helix-turn-helix protein [Prochlorococcus marinus str. LG]KGG19090.1 putative helix-turn-helix protein [Prochlorococcus marinus str. SS2]KGG23370.1 putative helix-turn-helix protein [Prochlorococcus marinus str. SS35]KGG32394.1 putative helix-turn-helix protein [Prochlorococcus marinus str. SS51]